MVQLASDDSQSVVVYDTKGVLLGKVRHPVGRRVLGPSEGTVYLERSVARARSHPRRNRLRPNRQPSRV